MSPFFPNCKTELQRRPCSMPHGLVINIRLHFSPVPQPVLHWMQMEAMRDFLGWREGWGLWSLRDLTNRRLKWLQAEAGVTRQPPPKLCYVPPACANGSCHHLHCFCALPRWVVLTHTGPGDTVKDNPLQGKNKAFLLLRWNMTFGSHHCSSSQSPQIPSKTATRFPQPTLAVQNPGLAQNM